MSDIKSLIDAISTGDSIGTEQSFNAAMAEKISAKLDTMRQNIAQTMFATEEYEQMDELSKNAYNRYLDQAGEHEDRLNRNIRIQTNNVQQSKDMVKHYPTGSIGDAHKGHIKAAEAEISAAKKLLKKREAGIDRAHALALRAEEYEQMDEAKPKRKRGPYVVTVHYHPVTHGFNGQRQGHTGQFDHLRPVVKKRILVPDAFSGDHAMSHVGDLMQQRGHKVLGIKLSKNQNPNEEYEQMDEVEQIDELSVHKMLQYDAAQKERRKELNTKWDAGTATPHDQNKVLGHEMGAERARAGIKAKTGKNPHQIGKLSRIKYAITREDIEQGNQTSDLVNSAVKVMDQGVAQNMFAETEEISEEGKKPSLGKLAASHWNHHTWATHGEEINDMSSKAAGVHKAKAKEIHGTIEKHYGKETADAVAQHSKHAADHDALLQGASVTGFHKPFVANHLGGHGSAEHKAYLAQLKKHDKEGWSTHQTDSDAN